MGNEKEPFDGKVVTAVVGSVLFVFCFACVALCGTGDGVDTTVGKQDAKPAKSKDVPGVAVVLKSIEFVSDHQVKEGVNLLKISVKGSSEKPKYGVVGSNITGPEWVKGKHTYPITHTKKTKISIKATVQVTPAQTTFRLIGDGSEDHVYVFFRSAVEAATGKDQEVSMSALEALPDQVDCLKEIITWGARIIQGNTTSDMPLGKSGGEKNLDGDTDVGHEIFVTWDTPQETCSRSKTIVDTYEDMKPFPGWQLTKPAIVNALTQRRIKLLCSPYGKEGVAGTKKDVPGIAVALHKWIRVESGIDTGGATAWTGPEIWGLIGKENNLKGQCAQVSFLMEMGMRLLGVQEAAFAHIKAAKELPVPVEYGVNEPQVKLHTRDHGQHGKEWLFMDFGGNRNEGEGTCIVGGKYYAGLVNVVADSPRDLLVKLTNQNHMVQRWYYGHLKLVGFRRVWDEEKQEWVLVPVYVPDWNPCTTQAIPAEEGGGL